VIGLYDVAPAQCVACGAELPDEPHEGNDGSCLACWEESQAKAAAQLEKERADQFQWLSGEWFRTAHLVRLPFNSRSERAYAMREAS
jgi:hypothetical protein